MNGRRAPALALFTFFFGLYALTSSGNAFRVPDEFEVYFQAEHLADGGDLSVPQTLAITEGGKPIFFGKIGRDGEPYAPYGPGVAFLILPFHAAGRALARLAGVPRRPIPEGIPWEFLVGGITTLAMAFAAALAVAGAYRAYVAIGAPARDASLLALLLGGGTFLWVYGTTLYCEAWLAAAFAWAAAFLLEARLMTGRPARGRVAMATVLVLIAILTKPTAVVIAPGFFAAVWLDARVTRRARISTLAALAVAVGVGGAVHLAWNYARFGNPMDFGYNLAGMIVRPPARSFAPGDIPRGLFVQLLTPGKAFLLWAPPVLLSIVALRGAWQRERAVVAGLLIATACALVFYAAFLYPEGGYAHGPRHLVPLVPLWLLPAAATGAVRTHWRLALATGIVGVAICALAVSVSFLEDQSPPVAPIANGPYYERIDPSPGRPWNRYRLDYVPFVAALTSGHWLDDRRPPGNGPDFFVVHLARARRLMPSGASIPASLPWVLGAAWLMVIGAASARL